MILLRTRRYGSAEWQETTFEGDLEIPSAMLFANSLWDQEGVAVQLRRPEEGWADLGDFDWEEEEE